MATQEVLSPGTKFEISEEQETQLPTPSTVRVGVDLTPRSETVCATDGDPSIHHPRIGCSPKAYKDVEKSVFSELLASGGLLAEHDRQETLFVQNILGLKSFWIHGPSDLNRVKRISKNEAVDDVHMYEDEDDQEGIYVGSK
ncbi:hypothetical protein BD410DRAFT_787788 [Rickenella mellea]|uniref:Uncharacterized protein n=1 Tax=Rickenella mellea TaxID=50990 RepID=A0A4Y7Q5P5_9AGAM|nr:hypothetical protein BD410DRAFT_787788 [Rickenella mellea]